MIARDKGSVVVCAVCGGEIDASSTSCFLCGYVRQSPALTKGQVIANRYELTGVLGRGGMGTVYQAHDRSLEEQVALKVLSEGAQGSAEAERRFRAEIRLARKIRHPNVCAIHEYGEHEGRQYIVMEFVDGQDLKKYLRSRGSLPPAEAIDLARQIGEGLQAIHDTGIIHRDLKLANVMRDTGGRLRLMDFGIAKGMAEKVRTKTGQILGTPEYMSPEQVHGQRVDARADVYSLGIATYELLTGSVPFKANTAEGTLYLQATAPPRLDAPTLPPAVAPVLGKALAKRPEERYESARAFIAALVAAPIPPSSDELTLAPPAADPDHTIGVVRHPVAWSPPYHTAPVVDPDPSPLPSTPPPRPSRPTRPVLIGGVLGAFVIIALLVTGLRKREEGTEPAQSGLRAAADPVETPIRPAGPAPQGHENKNAIEETSRTLKVDAARETTAVPPSPGPTRASIAPILEPVRSSSRPGAIRAGTDFGSSPTSPAAPSPPEAGRFIEKALDPSSQATPSVEPPASTAAHASPTPISQVEAAPSLLRPPALKATAELGPAAATAPGGPIQPVRVGGSIKEPTKLKNVTPVYPEIAQHANVEGIVVLECTISPQGRVTDMKTLRGTAVLARAARDAVKQWEYAPTIVDGVAVPIIATVTVKFVK